MPRKTPIPRNPLAACVPILLVLGLLAIPAPIPAADTEEGVAEVVVTATRIETAADEVSGTILVITAKDIEAKQARTVAEALAGQPGIDLVNQGGPGKASSVLLRGGDTRFTLVLVDGVEVNDPSNPERTFDFAHMDTADVERIEVLFGPQSTLYGSDAIGGVVQIITKKRPKGRRAEVWAEAGAFETRRGSASVGGGDARTSWSLTASASETEGISAASEADGNTEKDGYENVTLSGHLDVRVGSTGSVRLDVRSVDGENELDHYGGAGGDDPNFTGDASHLLLAAGLTLCPTDAWESVLTLSTSSHDRNDLNSPDPVRPFTMKLDFSGRSDKAEWINNLYLSDRSVLTVGLDTEKERAESSFFSDEFGAYSSTLDERSATISGLFVQEKYTTPAKVTWTVGARADDHSRFGGETTWRAGLSVPVARDARVRAVYGTGFRAPSIDQLFNADYGNPDLGAERSRGWDVGIESSIGPRASASLSWFLTEYDDLIAWFDADGDPATWWDGSYRNISEARTEGVDLDLEARLGVFSLGGTGSWLLTEDDHGENLLRRPETRFGARVGFSPSEKTSLRLAASWVGERKDWGGVAMGSYALVDLAGSFRIMENLELTGRVGNLLDERYEEAAGYGTAGRSAYIGVRARL